MTTPLNTVMVEFTRPDNVTAYTAGDVVSDSASATTPLEFASLARVNGGSGYIVAAQLTTQKKSITPRIRVHLYDVNTPTLAADNVAMKRLWSDEAKYLGYIDLPAMSSCSDVTTSDADSYAQDQGLRHRFQCATGTKSIYAVLETLDAFTPSPGQRFFLRLTADLN